MANGNNNPLDINYSLKIGTSIYHVMGKRKSDRKGNYDYYVLDDKLVRTKAPQRRSSQPMKVHGRAEQSEQTSFSDDRSEVNTNELKTALAEMMRQEREELFQNLQAQLDEERQAMRKRLEEKDSILEKQRQELMDLAKENNRLAEENNKKLSPIDTIQKLTEEISKKHELSAKEVEKLKQELTNSIENVIKKIDDDSQKKATSLDKIRDTVIDAMNSNGVTDNNIEKLKKAVENTIKEEVGKQKSIKIANLMDANAEEQDKQQQQQQQRQRTVRSSDKNETASEQQTNKPAKPKERHSTMGELA